MATVANTPKQRTLEYAGLMNEIQEQVKQVEDMDDYLSLSFSICDRIDIQLLSDRELSRIYIQLIESMHLRYKKDLKQSHLFSLLSIILDQNIKFDIDMELQVWNRFFRIYFQISNNGQCDEDVLYKLLTTNMLGPGSNVKPDIHTFEIVINGIYRYRSNLSHLQRFDLIQFIIEWILMDIYHLRATPTIQWTQWRILLKSHHMEYYSKQQNDALNIQDFNKILNSLPDIYGDALESVLPFILNVVMPKYGIKMYNYGTYRILYRLAEVSHTVQDLLSRFLRHSEFIKMRQTLNLTTKH